LFRHHKWLGPYGRENLDPDQSLLRFELIGIVPFKAGEDGSSRGAREGQMTESAQMMRIGLMGLVCLILVVLAALAHDSGFAFHRGVAFIAMAFYIIYLARRFPEGTSSDTSGYLDSVIRAGAIATVFWGLAGFLVGVVIALQLAYPALNLNLPWTNF